MARRPDQVMSEMARKLGSEIGPPLQLTQPNSLDVVASIGPDSSCWTPSGWTS